MSPDNHRDEELPELPPIDDDGSMFETGADELPSDESKNLDDSTLEDVPVDQFGAIDVIRDDGSLLDYADASDTLVVGDELMHSAEAGLLDDSDEGDGRAITADEAGLVSDEGSDLDDGGAEGTGEDPAGALEVVAEGRDASEAAEDEGIDDDARFEDGGAARARESLEREPWPSRADAAWTITRIDEKGVAAEENRPSPDLLVDSRNGALVISTDSGITWQRVAGCTGVTAATTLPSERQRMVIAALHDSARDASAVVLVRVGESVVAELVADFMADDADDDVRVESLSVRTRRVGRVEAVEVIARGPFGALLLTPKASG
jgi:hypothetical protein